MSKKKTIVVLFIVCALLLAGAATTIFFVTNSQDGNKEEIMSVSSNGIRTFADWTDCEVFQTVPVLFVENTTIGEATDVGEKMFVIDVTGTVKKDYDAYLKTLEEDKFEKYIDNGETGINENVYSATYKKGSLVVTVTHMVKTEKTYIYACEGLALSEHLVYKDEYVEGNQEGAETTLHLIELYDRGGSYVIQLKNGHFIVIDGGMENDGPYLFDYLESLTPEGERPVVEAWFFSHAHGDHVGGLQSLIEHTDWLKRIYLEGIYFNNPSNAVFSQIQSSDGKRMMYLQTIANRLTTQDGKRPGIYTPQTGQRYYFNDITIEIAFSEDAYNAANMSSDLNDTSTWCMYNIEGQKFLEAGDADTGSIAAVMRTYDPEYFDLDMFSVFHHGINVWNDFTDFISVETVIYTNYRVGSLWCTTSNAREKENAYLVASAKEAYGYGEGTVVFTFPYAVGTAEILPPTEWIYDTRERVFEIPRAEEWEARVVNE